MVENMHDKTVSYDNWFRREVEEGIREAENGELISLEEAMGDMLNEMERKSNKTGK